MTATILQFPLHRRLRPEFARLVGVAAERAERMGHACDRQALALQLTEIGIVLSVSRQIPAPRAG